MSACSYCGVYVRFLILGEVEGKRIWSPPLSPVDSKVKAKTKGLAPFEQPTEYRLTETYEVHVCEEGRVVQAQREQSYAMALEGRRKTEEAWTEALKGACPKCEAAPRCRCINLSDFRNNRAEVREVRYPHVERLPEGWGVEQ